MRLITVVAILALAGLGWWQRDAIKTTFPQLFAQPPTKSADTVYQWRDANGQVHFSNDKPPANAKVVKLQPLQTMPGMSKQEIEAINKRTSTAKQGTDANNQPPATCDQEDAMEQAKCIQAQTAVRNVAIDRMEKMANGQKP
ncbi:MAG: DUF4124 domain-containing protein [Burkholderiales bacterium]|nr:DUF4124 domain-containing protein [Burkholderiales bacterium]